MSEIEELFLGPGAFHGMHNLQILRFYRKWSDKTRLHLDEGLDCLSLPLQLRLLHWEACPMKCLPCPFPAKFLVEINMRESKLEKLWQGDPVSFLASVSWQPSLCFSFLSKQILHFVSLQLFSDA